MTEQEKKPLYLQSLFCNFSLTGFYLSVNNESNEKLGGNVPIKVTQTSRLW